MRVAYEAASGDHRKVNRLFQAIDSGKGRNFPSKRSLVFFVNDESISGILEFADVDNIVRAIKDKIYLGAIRIGFVPLEKPAVCLDMDDADAKSRSWHSSISIDLMIAVFHD